VDRRLWIAYAAHGTRRPRRIHWFSHVTACHVTRAARAARGDDDARVCHPAGPGRVPLAIGPAPPACTSLPRRPAHTT